MNLQTGKEINSREHSGMVLSVKEEGICTRLRRHNVDVDFLHLLPALLTGRKVNLPFERMAGEDTFLERT